MRLSREAFEALVAHALEELPDQVLAWLDNVVVQVEAFPSEEERRDLGLRTPYDLLGLYHGTPQTERDGYNLALPDRITLYQRPIEAVCATETQVVEEVRKTVLHELAHHFGIDDHRLDDMGL